MQSLKAPLCLASISFWTNIGMDGEIVHSNVEVMSSRNGNAA